MRVKLALFTAGRMDLHTLTRNCSRATAIILTNIVKIWVEQRIPIPTPYPDNSIFFNEVNL